MIVVETMESIISLVFHLNLDLVPEPTKADVFQKVYDVGYNT